MQFRHLWVGVAAACCAAGCGDDDGAIPVPTTPAAEQAATTTTAASTTTTVDFETEVKLAALELLELRNEVFMDPDPARVDEYVAETCVCLDRERQIVADLAATGRRWTGPAIVPLGIRLDREDPFGPSFTIIARQPRGAIVSAFGSEHVAEVELAPYHVSLARAADEGWRLNALEGLPTMDIDLASQIVTEEGLP